VKAAIYSRDRVFVSMLYDSGGRIGEILTLQRKNISFGESGAVVVMDGKTGQRRDRLILSVPFLSQWLSDHPDKRPDAPLWVHIGRGCHEDGIVPVDYSAMKILQRLKVKTGIKKAVNPHAFRHARATQLAGKLTEAQMKQIFGWTQDSRMASKYVHQSGRDTPTFGSRKIKASSNGSIGRLWKILRCLCPKKDCGRSISVCTCEYGFPISSLQRTSCSLLFGVDEADVNSHGLSPYIVLFGANISS